MNVRVLNSNESFKFDEASDDDSGSEDSSSDEETTPVKLSSQKLFDSFLQSYQNLLKDQPLLRKSLSCALVCALGSTFGNLHLTSNNSKTTGPPRRKALSNSLTNLQRFSEIGAFALYGGLVGGPMTHFWTRWLERHALSIYQSTSWNLLLDQLIAQPPMLLLMHLTLDMAGAAIREVPQAWNRSLERTGRSLVASWRFWPAAVYIM